MGHAIDDLCLRVCLHGFHHGGCQRAAQQRLGREDFGAALHPGCQQALAGLRTGVQLGQDAQLLIVAGKRFAAEQIAHGIGVVAYKYRHRRNVQAAYRGKEGGGDVCQAAACLGYLTRQEYHADSLVHLIQYLFTHGAACGVAEVEVLNVYVLLLQIIHDFRLRREGGVY